MQYAKFLCIWQVAYYKVGMKKCFLLLHKLSDCNSICNPENVSWHYKFPLQTYCTVLFCSVTFVGFEFPTVVVNIPCSPLEVNQYFGGTCCLHLHGWSLNQARSQKALSLLPASCWFLARLTLQPWRWRQYVPLKHHMTFSGLYGITCHKLKLFNVIFVFHLDLSVWGVSQHPVIQAQQQGEIWEIEEP
jgi:hypothetical protein